MKRKICLFHWAERSRKMLLAATYDLLAFLQKKAILPWESACCLQLAFTVYVLSKIIIIIIIMRVGCSNNTEMQANRHMMQAAFLRLYIRGLQAASSTGKRWFWGNYFCPNIKNCWQENVRQMNEDELIF